MADEINVLQGGLAEELSRIITKRASRRVLLVTGRSSFRSCGAHQTLTSLFGDLGIIFDRFSDFAVNPRLEDAVKGAEQARNFSPDLIVAIGGGSVLDMAKLIRALLVIPGPVESLLSHVYGSLPQGLCLVAVPTTAGTGSEATHFAVVYHQKQKYSFADPNVLPDKVILDPNLTLGLSARLTAISGFDALSQAIEAYWAVGATDESQGYSKIAIRLLWSSLESAVNQPSELNRERMLEGAYWAGRAINIAKTTAAHALSYPLTSNYGIPHGHAVALSLGKILILNSQVEQFQPADPLSRECVAQRLQDLCYLLGAEGPEQACGKLYRLMEKVGLETSLNQLGVCSQLAATQVLSAVNVERLGNNPLRLTPAALALIWSDEGSDG
ncbi:iron-containing alcohol dehydrogenase family protein [Motiliproteus coralliicola]|uniref:Iron-containing alcohol dehydrogenase family protein n=1 Tax=Motiliproteus coralliicola TaxID=2283196 RepID=A0A369WLN2_9GAMM|nr:phosphonoacetaldehyde reductase [Motiliproteus coralliicola]RDE22978.1 iron-containing alcohol dehydrogenase family protein [Motiliproteus coralliicola]